MGLDGPVDKKIVNPGCSVDGARETRLRKGSGHSKMYGTPTDSCLRTVAVAFHRFTAVRCQLSAPGMYRHRKVDSVAIFFSPVRTVNWWRTTSPIHIFLANDIVRPSVKNAV